jgi:dTDP-4-dehydrorhamnose 3,5-epimerase
MQVKESEIITDLKIITPQIFSDMRGQSVETFSEKEYVFCDAGNAGIKFVEDDVSISNYNVLRGLHGDTATWKLIQCLWGEVFFVVLDMRQGSPSYLKWESFTLNDKNRQQVLIPAGCVNGHLCLSEKCLFSYKQSQYYGGAAKQITVKWDDPKFNIPWPLKHPILSERDATANYFNNKKINK